MGTSLTGLTPATTYDALIKVGDNGPITSTLKTLSDGLGNDLPMEASTTAINFTNGLQQGGVAVPTASQVAAKQDTLVSGTNIKTVNSTSLLGSGNVAVQDVLVSGTNIKTINGTSVLGSGNIVTPTTNPSGVSGAIQFSNGSAFASDAANLFWDDTNKRLGIGTNAPTSSLTFGASKFITFTNGSFNGYVGEFALNNILNIGTSSGFPIAFRPDNVERMRIASGGNVGIGTTTPSQPLQVNGNIQGTNLISTSNVACGNVLYNNNFYCESSGNTNIGGGQAPSTARLQVKGQGSTSATTSLLVQNSAGTQALKVDDSLRTTVNNLNITSNYPSLSIGSVNSVDFGDGLRIGYDGAVTKVTLYTNAGTPQLQVNNSGQISVGTTSPQASAKFEIASTTLGFLPPRMTTTQKNAITTPASGLVVYDTTTNKLCCYNGSTWNDLF